ncbi:MAG: hypothetical protein SNI20_06190 [Rikenellaceae bacterium]
MIFLFATEKEAAPFRARCPHTTIEICGVGAAECAASTARIIASMRERAGGQTLILAGIAGSYSPEDVALCQVVEVVDETIAALPERFARHYTTEPHTQLRAVSSNSVNSQGEATCSAQIENMEGAAFMAVCQKLGVKGVQIRAISNKVGDPLEEWRVDEACQALATELEKLTRGKKS